MDTKSELFELVNPSDYYTFRCSNRNIAILAALLLSPNYVVKSHNNEWSGPLFSFGGLDQWIQDTFSCKLEKAFKQYAAELAAALETLIIGNRADFDSAVAAIDDPDKRRKFVEQWKDRHQSSCNDIGGKAVDIACKLRELKPLGPPTERTDDESLR